MKKRLKVELTSIINTHEETNVEDSGLSTKVRRNKGKIKLWKEG